VYRIRTTEKEALAQQGVVEPNKGEEDEWLTINVIKTRSSKHYW
jgi:hypothetical protein